MAPSQEINGRKQVLRQLQKTYWDGEDAVQFSIVSSRHGQQ